MANDQKPPNLASGGILVASLAVAGSLFFAHEAPFQGSRPVMSEPQLHQSATSQDIDARLWQDPFAAVAKSLDSGGDSQDRSSTKEHCIQNPDGPHCASPLTDKDKNTLVIAVTMSGAPYAEENEARRRTRFAVLAGLKRAGFVPEDAQHIGYFEWLPQGLGQSPNQIATEVWLRPIHDLMLRPIHDLMLPPPRGQKKPPEDQTAAAFWARLPQDLPPVFPDQKTTVVPYERFRPIDLQSSERTSQRILVVWLDEDALYGSPLDTLAGLAKFLRSRSDPSARDRQIRILGPEYSDTLHAMAIEARSFATENCEVKKEPWPGLEGVQFYTYSASAEDIQLLNGLNTTCTSVHDYFANLGIDIRRTIATDDVLARGIVDELKLRKVEPGTSSLEGKAHVALISEWDTFYGQTFPDTMERCFEDPDCQPKKDSGHPPWVHRLTYLRGLDGQLPGAQGTAGTGDRKTGKGTEETDKQARVTDFFKTKSDVNGGDRPNGQGQQDYLRRLADHLRKIDDDLRRGNPKDRIRAIGILGSDVFDKLLVLQALRPNFPEALFFTIDFDATLTMGSELDWTRNLIVSSSFGPELRQEIQDEIPPFRSSYQPAAFLATRLAIGDPSNNWCTRVGQKHLSRWLSRARIVEIERTGNVLPFPADGDLIGPIPPPEECEDLGPLDNMQRVAGLSPPQERRSVSGTCTDLNHLEYCGNIQPPSEEQDFYPIAEPEGLNLIARTLAGAAILTLLTLCFGRVRDRAWVEVSLVGLIVGAAAVACFNWEWFAKLLTEDGKGEPIALMQGVSLWPTILLRELSVVLSIYLLLRAWKKLDENLLEIAREMNLPMPNLAIAAEREANKGHSFEKKLVRIFRYSLREHQPDRSKRYNIKTAWSEYVYKGRWVARLLRVVFYTATMFCLWFYVVSPMIGHTFSPHRGDLSKQVLRYTSKGEIISMLALMYLVFDATLLCLCFVKELSRSFTEWPDDTRDEYEARFGLKHQFVDKWIDLDFVAKRTRCISTLIYYPFILIALLLVTRSTVFANFTPNLKIFAFQGTCLTIVFGCALALCWAAQSMRSAAKLKLSDGIICAKGPCGKELDGGGRHAGQLETLLVRVDDLRDGAFSPLSQQPFARALLLPLGSFGWTTLLQNGMLPGL
jgi:hypothetical protein